MNEPQTHIYEFSDFRVDAAKRLLLKGDGESLPLTPKVFDTLLYLVRHAGKIIEKDELMREIWVDTIVEENNLSQNISILRRILGEKRGEHRFIATIPGKGFKFVASVQVSSFEFQVPVSVESAIEPPELPNESESEIEHLKLQDEPETRKLKPETNQLQRPKTENQFAKDKEQRTKDEKPIRFWRVAVFSAFLLGLSLLSFYAWRENRKAVSAVKTVAVLPFKPLVADNRDEALEMGMADTLITRLGDNREIVVRPLSSVRRYGNLEQDALQAGRALDVDSVLDGNIQRWGDKIRVNVRLIKTADGSSLWTGTFDEKFTDIFVVQDAISKKVAAALAVRLSGDEQTRLEKRYTNNAEAYELYLRGRYHFFKITPPEMRKAIGFYQEAIEADPNYALAYAGMADAYRTAAIANYAPSKDVCPQAKALAMRALEIDESVADAHIVLGWVGFLFDWDWVKRRKRTTESHRTCPEQFRGASRLRASVVEYGATRRSRCNGQTSQRTRPADVHHRRA